MGIAAGPSDRRARPRRGDAGCARRILRRDGSSARHWRSWTRLGASLVQVSAVVNELIAPLRLSIFFACESCREKHFTQRRRGETAQGNTPAGLTNAPSLTVGLGPRSY